MSTGPALRPLTAVRLAFGVALILAPARVVRALTGRAPDRRVRELARLLGARHVLQAEVLGRSGGRALLAGAGVDALHALVAAGFAVAEPRRRRVFAANAAAASFLAVEGAMRSRATPRQAPPAPRPGSSARGGDAPE